MTITKDNKDVAHRLPTKRKGAVSPILFKFVQRWVKEEAVDRMYAKGKMTTKGLNYSGHEQQIYVSEHLTPRLQELHFKARQLKKEKKVDKVKVRNGKFFVKKTGKCSRLALLGQPHI